MKIQFATELQKHIADLLWKAEGKDGVAAVIKVYGKEAEVVFHMIMATYYDTVNNVDLAAELLQNIFHNGK